MSDTCSICYRDVDDGVACGDCSGLDEAHEKLEQLEKALARMTTFRDNAAFRETMALRERDEARAERDALYRSLVRSGGDRLKAKSLMRLARGRVAKKRTAGLCSPTQSNTEGSNG